MDLQQPQRSKSKKIWMLVFSIAIVGLLAGTGASYTKTKLTSSDSADTLKVLEERNFEVPLQDAPQEPSALGALKEYKDPELGLSFKYPEAWGEVKRNNAGDPDREFYTSPGVDSSMDYTFSKAPLILMPIINNKNSYLINQSACFLALGFLNATIDQSKVEKPYSTDWEQSEIAKGNHYATYSRSFEISKDRIIIQNYSISTVVSQSGYCNGLRVYGEQKPAGNGKVQFVQFVWSETAKDFGKTQKPLDIPDLDAFKKDPKKYFSDQDMESLRAMLASIKTE